MSDEIESGTAYCGCDPFTLGGVSTIGGVLVHGACGLPVECEFSYLDDNPHPATTVHIDYTVCADHLRIAVDNVVFRWL